MCGLLPNENKVINEYTHNIEFCGKFSFRKCDTDSILKKKKTSMNFVSETEGMGFLFVCLFLTFTFLKGYPV